MSESVSQDMPCGDTPTDGRSFRYRVRESPEGRTLAIARADPEHDRLLVTDRSGQHLWLSPAQAWAIVACLSMATLGSFPETEAAAEFVVERKPWGQGEWTPWVGDQP